MDLPGLVVFAEVAEMGSFAAASRKLNVPTTNVSRQIQQLEASLNGKLLNRTTRSLSLTELGEQVLPKAQLMKETLVQVQQLAEQQQANPSGRLKISATRSYALYVLTDWFCEFREQFPGVDLTIDLQNQFIDLNAAGIDFAFRLGPLADSSNIALPLHPIRYKLFASRTYLASLPFKLETPQDLDRCQLVQGHIEGSPMRWPLVKDGSEFTLQPQGAVMMDDLVMVKEFVLKNAGVGFVPTFLFSETERQEEIIEVLPDYRAAERSIYLIYPDRKYLPNKSQAFIDFIREKISTTQQELS